WKKIGVLSSNGDLQVVADHTAAFDSQITTVAGGALAGAGASVDHFVNAKVTSGVGDRVNITARDVDMTATNRANKTQAGGSNNSKGTTGGLVSGAGAETSPLINRDTQVEVGDFSRIETTGLASNSLDFELRSKNIINVHAKVSFITGGALSGAGATLVMLID